MRFWPKKGSRVLVVGIFQSAGAGRAVLQNLYRARFRCAAAIYASAKGRQRVEEPGISAIGGSAAGLIVTIVLGAFIFWVRGTLGDNRLVEVTLPLAGFGFGGAIAGWILVRLLRRHVDSASFARFTNTILPNETVILVEVEASETSEVLAILREVEAEAPVTFGFYPPPPFPSEATARPPSHELFSSRHLVAKAASLAQAITVSRTVKPRGPSFLHRLLEIENALEWTNMSLTMSDEAQHAFTLSAEWLLDNAYLIREQVADLRKSLPQKYYGKLPLIASGPGAGLPRVYQVAVEMVAETDGALDPEIIRRFLAAFQAITPLDIGELWALPLMLRLQLLECLRTLAILVDQQQRESEEADFWANRLITAVRHSSPRLLKIMEELVERYPEPTPH